MLWFRTPQKVYFKKGCLPVALREIEEVLHRKRAFLVTDEFLFKSGKDFMMGDTYGAASYLNILAPELTDKVLAEFLDMDKNLVVSIHVQSVDQLKAIKLIKGKITDLDRMKIEEQKKAVRSGYDMEIIPSDLATYGGEAKKILDDLQSRNERMFLVTAVSYTHLTLPTT